jgi:leucyl aminopeptidase
LALTFLQLLLLGLDDASLFYREVLSGAYDAIKAHKAVDSAADSDVSVLPFPCGAGGRLVVSPTGQLDRDYDDCRRFFDAAEKGIERAIKAGARAPLLLVYTSTADSARFPKATDAAVLGAHTAMYVFFILGVRRDIFGNHI